MAGEVGWTECFDHAPVMIENAPGFGRDRVRVVAAGRQAVRPAHDDDRQRRQIGRVAPAQQGREEPAEVAGGGEPELEGEIRVGDPLATGREGGQAFEGGLSACEPPGDQVGASRSTRASTSSRRPVDATIM